uniref:Uncharacterized protein n=1 Tax=Cacopsylla melanoneura TaxID=428564 RepID=A0A8D8YZQ7_9HEMI
MECLFPVCKGPVVFHGFIHQPYNYWFRHNKFWHSTAVGFFNLCQRIGKSQLVSNIFHDFQYVFVLLVYLLWNFVQNNKQVVIFGFFCSRICCCEVPTVVRTVLSGIQRVVLSGIQREVLSGIQTAHTTHKAQY